MAGIIAAIANIMSISFSNDGETFFNWKLNFSLSHTVARTLLRERVKHR